MVTKLSVNINKVALIRNSRNSNIPDLITVAKDCEAFGADGITVHPRPDERHVRYSDLEPLKDVVTTEFNIEGYPNKKFIDAVLAVKPDQCTLVPDAPGVLTSTEGWNVETHSSLLTDVIQDLKQKGIRVSLFMEANANLMDSAAKVGADRVEFYTGHYAEAFHIDPSATVARHVEAAKIANTLGLGINAGHDLNLKNLQFYKEAMPYLQEVSIGHALISDALYYGLQNVIMMYKRQIT